MAKQHKWIPVTEALPGLNQVVLLTNDGEAYSDKHGEGFSGCYTVPGMLNDDFEWETFGDDCQMIEITAWMPLPEPMMKGAKR